MKHLSAVTAALLALPTAATAADQLDQEFTGLWYSSFIYQRPYVAAQTFTAGVSGKLVKIALDMGPDSGPANVEIRDVVNGLPGTNVLATGTLNPQLRFPPPEIASMVEVALDRPMMQMSGVQYAIVITGANDQSYGQWIASSSYLGGARYLSMDQGRTWYYTDNGDGHFRTYVERVDSGPPVISLVSPYDGAKYVMRDPIKAAFSCSDDNSVISCVGAVENGALIDTKTPGEKQFSVSSVDSFNKATVKVIRYTVIPPGQAKKAN